LPDSDEFDSRVSVSCQKAPVADESGWSVCTGNPIWRTFLTSLSILLDVQRGLDTLQMPRRVDLPARNAAGLDPRSQLVEVLRGWDLESRSLGNVLVAPKLSGWARESLEAYRGVGDNSTSEACSQIPLMGFTCQLYMGRRAWVLFGRKRWFGILMVVLPIITLLAGIA
jgi:hypothetical protein